MRMYKYAFNRIINMCPSNSTSFQNFEMDSTVDATDSMEVLLILPWIKASAGFVGLHAGLGCLLQL